MINMLIPFVVLIYFSYFAFKNNFKEVLAGLLIVSFFVFSTNYENFGLELDIYRYLHRLIGITIVLSLFHHIFIKRINIFKDLVARLLLLFFLVLLLSFIGNELNLNHYLHYVRNFIFVGFLALYLYYVLNSNDKVLNLFNLIISITLILSLFISFEVFQNGWGNRVGLFYGNPNYLAYSLLPGLAFVAFSENKYIQIISLPIIIFAIFATGSRAAEISSIFIVVLYILQIGFKKIYLITIFSLIIILFFIFFEKIVTNQNLNNSRYVITKISLNIIKNNPINGIGYGQFRTKFTDYVDQDIMNMNNNDINDMLRKYTVSFGYSAPVGQLTAQGIPAFHYEARSLEKMTHNDLLTITTELGLFGFLYLIYFFYKLYLELKKLLINNLNYFFISISLIGGSLIFSLFHNNLTSFMFWFVLIIPFIINRNHLIKT